MRGVDVNTESMVGVSGAGVSGVEVARARAGLLRVCEPPSAAVAVYVDRVGAVQAWRGVLTGRAPRSVLSATAARTAGVSAAEAVRRADADLAAAAAVGARLIGPGDAQWPAAAFAAFDGALVRGVHGACAPLALYVRGGSLAGLPCDGVTIVGSRASSAYGQRVAGDMAHCLVSAGLTVISGAAFGIDTAAHRGALQAGGDGEPPTVAVLACGIDRAYPEANRALLESIGAVGAVVSEYPPGTTPARHRFLVRNRIIAALGAGTVVVEAGRRSGTLSTAAAADQLGRLVMAVPGPVTSAMSVGCHLLLADRFAQLVTGPKDVLAALGRASDPAAQPTLPGTDPRHPTDGLDADTARVYEALPGRGTVTAADVIAESGLVGPQVLAALAVLELHGLAERDGPRWRRVVTRR
jgi:DNA processing protein